MAEFTVRQAQPEDADQIFSIRSATWLNTYPNPDLGITIEMLHEKFKDTEAGVAKTRKYLENQDHTRTWVAEEDGVIAGFIVASIADGKQEILAAYVLPEYQGEGIGSKLMTTALDWFGVGDVDVHVASYNQQAIDYYSKFDFEIIGDLAEGLTQLPGGKVIPELLMRRRSAV